MQLGLWLRDHERHGISCSLLKNVKRKEGSPMIETNVATVAAAVLAELAVPPTSWRQPVLTGLFGLPDAGKTTVAQWIAERHPLVLLSTDALRLRYHLPSGPATLAVMEQVARHLLAGCASVIFDGIHQGRRDRQALRALGAQCGAQTTFVYVTAPAATLALRLQARRDNPEQTAAEGKFVISPEHFARIAAFLEPPTDGEDVLRVDTEESPLQGQLTALDRQLRALRGDATMHNDETGVWR
jgi:predicted kinase